MQFVLKILHKYLANEKRWLGYENIAIDAKTKAGVEMAKARVPQLEKAIQILSQTTTTELPIKPKRQPKPLRQLSLWQIKNS